MGCVKRGGDGSDLYLEGYGDRAVVEVEVVAKEESLALSLWKPQNSVTNDGVAFVRSGHRFSSDVLRFHFHTRGGAIQVMGRVDDASREPGIEQT